MQLHRGSDSILCVHKTKKHIRKSDSTLSSDDLHFARGKNLKWVGFGVKTHLITYLSDHHKKVLDTYRIKKQFLFLFFILPNTTVVNYIKLIYLNKYKLHYVQTNCFFKVANQYVITKWRLKIQFQLTFSKFNLCKLHT